MKCVLIAAAVNNKFSIVHTHTEVTNAMTLSIVYTYHSRAKVLV